MSASRSTSRTVLVVGVLMIGGLLACGDDGDESTTTSAIPSTTIDVPTTATTAPVELLVAHEAGIDLWSEETQTAIVTGRPVAIAVPDHRGGVVFQADAEPPVPIEWIPAIGDEPVVIVSEPDARWLGLEDVALIDGVPTLVYRVSRTLPNPCAPNDEECRWGYQVDYLVTRDLATGEEKNLGIIGTFESSGRRYDFGGRHAAVRVSPYGEADSCVGLLDASLILDGSADRYIGEGSQDRVTWLVNGDCGAGSGDSAATGSCTSRAEVAMAPDGESLAVAYTTGQVLADGARVPEPTTLVVIDAATLRELRRVVVAEAGTIPTWVDFDGERAVVGLSLDGQAESPVLVDSDDSVIELDLDGVVRIWPPASGTE